ncbi:hypothetical protein Tco_0277885 [Tanacetum coccineum]
MSLSWPTRSVNLMLRYSARLSTCAQEFKEKNSLYLHLKRNYSPFLLNIDFAELIWEDFLYQIDNSQLKKGRRENMPYPRFTKVIINHFLSIHNTIPKGLSSGLNTIKDDGVLSRMKFVRIGKDVQEYGKAIPDTKLTNAIK